MKVEEKSIVKAPIQDIWDFLLDPNRLAFCVPGCEKVEILGDNSYLVTEVLKVGPIAARFNLKVSITEMTSPSFLSATIEGTDSKTYSRLKARIVINLEPISGSETQVNHMVDVALGGILGKFGEGVIRRKADSLTEEFAGKIRAKLEV
ncbi:CoxG family protein [Chloroflexota bacterium]